MLAWLRRTWFPLALVALFLTALPGVVLSILGLVGIENDVNAWLQDNFSLSYHPALPPVVTVVCAPVASRHYSALLPQVEA